MISPAIRQQFAGKRCLVTGGTGLIGRQVVRLLCDADAVVTVVSLDEITVDERAEHIFGDLRELSFCREITKGMDYVLHIAGIKGSVRVTKSRPASFFVPLLMMNTNILEACRLNDVAKVVYTSSIGAYSSREIFRETDPEDGPPMDWFPGWAKRAAELQIQAYRIQYGLDGFSVVRPCNVYGPGDNFDPENAMVIPSLLYRIRQKEDPLVVWGDGSAVRDFAFSRDVAQGLILALLHGTGGHPFLNLGSGRGYTIRELVEALHSFLTFNHVFDAEKPAGFPKRVMDISLARQVIGYDPATPLEQGLRETWEWFAEHHDEHLHKKNYFKDA